MLLPTRRLPSRVRFTNLSPDRRSCVHFSIYSPGHSPDPASIKSATPPIIPERSPEEQTAEEGQEKKTENFVAEKPLPNPLHVYRSLLRALTYLPDSWARTILQNQIRTEFKTSKPKKSVHGADLHRRRLKEGLRDARCIQRAGNGNREALEKVLLIAYGRLGKRRRELLGDLLKRDDGEPLTTIPLTKSLRENKLLEILQRLPALHHLSTQKFSTFIKSQTERTPAGSAYNRPKLKLLIPPIPKENIWGRPVPKSRQVNIVKKWWSETLDRVFPPVPQSEWDRLRDLSRGAIRIPERIPRRAYRNPTGSIEQRHEMVLEQLKNSRAGGNVVFDPKQGLYLKREEKDEDAEMVPQNYQRTMRRLYNSIWNLTPVMWRDEETNDWNVKWGEMKTEFHSGKIPQASEADPFFDDLPNARPAPKRLSRIAERRAKLRLRKQSRIVEGGNTDAKEVIQEPKG